ncbi:MAG: UDP-N-acetylmuramate--L-alanine ligase [Bacteroidales bacterium]|nr:UDP-N-acetylmuramate--L-alanine ligase [Bacteroidales bacterium]
MKPLPKQGTVYFLGIGGIGMSALARYFLSKGWQVHGYDKTPTSLTASLQKEGMRIHFEEDLSKIPAHIDLIIFTPAIPANHAEYQFLLKKGATLHKRAEVLGMIAADYNTIAIAGTHGKTTTSTMTAHLMKQSVKGCQAFLGGISKNYESNLLLTEQSEYLVAEADEYDRSFLQLSPNTAVITSMDADHLDIYGNHDALLQSFTEFAGKIRKGGNLVLKLGLELTLPEESGIQTYSYSLDQSSDFHAENLKLKDGLYHFDFIHPNGKITGMVLGIPGLYNVENAVAALACSWLCGVSENELKNAIASFSGVRRRFDIRFRSEKAVYIDDYAHHPAELTASISSARKLFQGKTITGIFQPHLYSRTRDFASEFAISLDLLDYVILLPIYPARELPIEGVSSQLLFDNISKPSRLVEMTDFPSILDEIPFEVLMTLGAGDIDTLAAPIENYLSGREVKK